MIKSNDRLGLWRCCSEHSVSMDEFKRYILDNLPAVSIPTPVQPGAGLASGPFFSEIISGNQPALWTWAANPGNQIWLITVGLTVDAPSAGDTATVTVNWTDQQLGAQAQPLPVWDMSVSKTYSEQLLVYVLAGTTPSIDVATATGVATYVVRVAALFVGN